MRDRLKICTVILGIALCLISQASLAHGMENLEKDPPKCTHDGKDYSEGADHPGNSDKECKGGSWEEKD